MTVRVYRFTYPLSIKGGKPNQVGGPASDKGENKEKFDPGVGVEGVTYLRSDAHVRFVPEWCAEICEWVDDAVE